MSKPKALALKAVLALTAWFMLSNWWHNVNLVPIQVVSLTEKLQYADPAAVKAAVTEEVKRGFFGLRLPVIRAKLLQVPWVADAQVQRRWPGILQIKIIERQPLALLGPGYERIGVIDTVGKLVETDLQLNDLPTFSGPKDQINAMVDTYLLILAKIKPLGLAVKSLALMPDSGWRATLNNDVAIILGQTALEERLTRFVLAYKDQKSVLRGNNVHSIDLRYTNGLAIGGSAVGI